MPTKKISVLFVEDNKALLDNLSEYFASGDFDPDFAADGLTALHLLATNRYDVVVLDVLLPGISGIQICKKIRHELNSSVPVILLTALDAIENKVDGFEAGANDYLCKPFDMRELELRIRALSRPKRHDPDIYTAAQISFHAGSLTITMPGKDRLLLSGLNATLFETLIKAYPRYVDYETLSTQLWGIPSTEEHTIRTHVYTLRKLLKQHFGRSMIRGIYGRGYQLDPEFI